MWYIFMHILVSIIIWMNLVILLLKYKRISNSKVINKNIAIITILSFVPFMGVVINLILVFVTYENIVDYQITNEVRQYYNINDKVEYYENDK